MFKKLTILILLIIYSFTSFGLSVNLFYCCGKLANISLKADPKNEKNCPVKEKSDDCCKDKTITIKISDDQLNNSFVNFYLTHPGAIAIIPVLFQEFQTPFINDLKVNNWETGLPPPLIKNRSILFSVFRI